MQQTSRRPKMLNDQKQVMVTLSELHSWILKAREIMYDKKHEDMVMPRKVVLKGRKKYSARAVRRVQTQFRKILTDINEFDCLFHDEFDCQ
jgi:hypothetical protein